MAVVGIVVAAGDGRRFASAGRGGPARTATVAKQFLPFGGRRIVDHAVAAAVAACGDVVLVLPAGVAWDGDPIRAVTTGGASRSASVRAGLAVCHERDDI